MFAPAGVERSACSTVAAARRRSLCREEPWVCYGVRGMGGFVHEAGGVCLVSAGGLAGGLEGGRAWDGG
jgi:hypothetical protein